ncbi:MAG: hypothetical protein CMO01_04450 [Thalassobius sp.]|nr:hypothetical protein [Thalassovita sp.]
MGFLNNIFGKKKQKPASAKCDISDTMLEFGEGYLLTSAQIIDSRSFWDMMMLQPETKSYTISHFENQDPSARSIRQMIFNKYAGKEEPWIVSDTYVKMFDVDKEKSREYAKEWWSSEKSFRPPNCGVAKENLPAEKFNSLEEYAVMEAGKEAVENS